MRPIPECSVIIAARNAALWLPEAVASIGAHARAEILVVDDGSFDGTDALLGRMAAADPRIVALRGPDRGAGAARNAAIAVASAPLLAFLDPKDRWRPDRLEMQLALHIARPDIGFSFTDAQRATISGAARGRAFEGWDDLASRHGAPRDCFAFGAEAMGPLFRADVIATSAVMVRTRLVRAAGGFDERLRPAEAWDLWLRLAQRAPVGCLPLVGVEQVIHPGGPDARARRKVAARHAMVLADGPGPATPLARAARWLGALGRGLGRRPLPVVLPVQGALS